MRFMTGAALTAIVFVSSIALSQIREVPYEFEPAKVSSVRSSLDFFRTFVDYFYLLEKENFEAQPFVNSQWAASGWCMGDAHLENFGTQLLRTGRAIFAVNDWDDAAPCPVILDFFRLAVSAVLVHPRMNLELLQEAYLRGAKGGSYPLPAMIAAMVKKSEKQGFEPSDKVVRNGRFVRSKESFELRPEERAAIKNILMQWPRYRWVDGIRKTKMSGGSFGLLRYELLLEDSQSSNRRIHLELKEQAKPATLAVLRGGQIPNATERNLRSLQIVQGDKASEFYGVYVVLKKTMLLRPRFAGNDSWKSQAANVQDFNAVVAYEAYLLGKQRAQIPVLAWNNSQYQQDVRRFADFISKKYMQVVRP
jgi:hypothetical protein